MRAKLSPCVAAVTLALLLLARGGFAAATSEQKVLLVILDASRSMSGQQGEARSIFLARHAVLDLLRDLPGNVAFGVMVVGHRSATDCADVELLKPIATRNLAGREELSRAVARIDARGSAAVARGVAAAAAQLSGRAGGVLVLTGGTGKVGECPADLCGAVEALHKAAPGIRVDLIGVGLGEAERERFACVATLSPGGYHPAVDAEGLAEAVAGATQAALGGGRLEVSVNDGERGKARTAYVTVHAKGVPALTSTDNPSRFQLATGDYEVTARAGNGASSEPTKVKVEADKTTRIVIDSGR
jgi:hypothetical protein